MGNPRREFMFACEGGGVSTPVAKPLRVTATSDDGIVEALELRREDAHLLPYFMTVQFHPERLAPRYPEHQALFNSFTRACMMNRNSTL